MQMQMHMYMHMHKHMQMQMQMHMYMYMYMYIAGRRAWVPNTCCSGFVPPTKTRTAGFGHPGSASGFGFRLPAAVSQQQSLSNNLSATVQAGRLSATVSSRTQAGRLSATVSQQQSLSEYLSLATTQKPKPCR